MLILECFLLSRAVVFPLLQPSAYVLEVFKKVKSRWVPRASLLNRFVTECWVSRPRIGWDPWVVSCKEWAVLESLESLFLAASFGICMGNWKYSFHGESGLKFLGVGWLLWDGNVCRDVESSFPEEGRLCACSLCHKMPGLCRCRAVMDQLWEMLSTAEYQNPPMWMCFLLISSSDWD